MAAYDPLNPSEPDEDSEGFTLPPRAGAGTLMGLRPADWVAMLGGLLSGVRIGSPQARAQGGGLRPGLALFPLAQGLEAGDRRARSAEGVKALQSQYGGMEDLPEFKTALMLAQQDDWKGAMNLLGRGITDRNVRAREARTAERTGQAAEGYGTAMRPVTEPGITGVRPMTQEDLLAPPTTAPTRNWQDVDRPPEIGEIINRLQTEIKDPVVRGLAFDKANQALATRTAEEAKLRPKTEVKDNRFIRYDPRRGTAEAGAELPETKAQAAIRGQREARTAELKALTAKHERDPNAPLGSKLNPHGSVKVMLDPADGIRKQMQVWSWTEPDPRSESGVARRTKVEPLGAYPFKPPAPRGGGAVDTTTTVDVESTRPSRPIWKAEDLESINKGLPKVLNDIAPGFNPPGLDEVVVLPKSGQKSTGREVLDQLAKDLTAEYKAKHGLDVNIRWVPTPGILGRNKNKGEFRVTGAAESAQKLPKKSVTTKQKGFLPPPVLPPGSVPADDGDDDND